MAGASKWIRGMDENLDFLKADPRLARESACVFRSLGICLMEKVVNLTARDLAKSRYKIILESLAANSPFI